MTNTTDAPHKDEGLRERKRAATQAAIERAALELALKHGYDNTTVEMICDASLVSPRTFFNYFGSKEAVILGPSPSMPSEEAIAAFTHSTNLDVLGELVELITTTLLDHELDAALFRSRRLVIQRTPDLAHAELSRMIRRQDELVALVRARFTAQGRDTTHTPDLEDEARMVVSLANGVMHFALHKWLRGASSQNPGKLLHDAIGMVQRVTNP